MPTYEYECGRCGVRFERFKDMTDPPVAACPECEGNVRRLISGGAGFMLKGSGHTGHTGRTGPCALEQSGTTCCGREERCENPCGERP